MFQFPQAFACALDLPICMRFGDKVMRPFDNLERDWAQNGVSLPLITFRGLKLAELLTPGAAQRRAVAKFHGLLTNGRNRRNLYRNSLSGSPWETLDLAGGTALIVRRLIVPMTVAIVLGHAGQCLAQGAFPAPLPNQGTIPNDPAFPPVNGAAPSASVGTTPGSFPVNGAPPINGSAFERPPAPPSQGGGSAEACMKGFLPLREDAEKRGKMIKAASDRHAAPDEACKLIKNFSQAEINMIKYVESHASKCGIPAQIADQLKAGHNNTENMLKKVCAVAQQAQQRGPAGPSLSEVLGSSAALPEATATAKKGGSTFDTLNGNVLTR
jgi:hypothetical protein